MEMKVYYMFEGDEDVVSVPVNCTCGELRNKIHEKQKLVPPIQFYEVVYDNTVMKARIPLNSILSPLSNDATCLLELRMKANISTMQQEAQQLTLSQLPSGPNDSIIQLWKTIIMSHISTEHAIIVHPKQELWPVIGQTRFYIRDVYRKIGVKIMEKILAVTNMRNGGTVCGNCNALVIGTSGTGKSCFVFYLFIYLLTLQSSDRQKMPEILTFRYKRFDGTDCYLDSSGEARAYGGEVVDIFISDDCDIHRADAASLISILISSEQSNNRKTFSKLVPCSTVNLSVCMPTWTLAELKHIAPPNMTDDVMNLRYQVFGGSARNFISCPDFNDDPDGSFPFVCDILNWFLAEEIRMLNTNDQSRDVRCIVEHIKTELSKHTQGQVEGVNMFRSLMWHTDNGREFFWASRVMEMIGSCILKEKSLSHL